MKQSRKLSYNERTIVASWGLNPMNWRRGKEFADRFEIVNKLDGTVREVPRHKKGEGR